MLIKRLAPVGVIAVLALLVLGGVNFLNDRSLTDETLTVEPVKSKTILGNLLSPRTAYAKEIINQSIASVEKVTIEMVDGKPVVKKQNGEIVTLDQENTGYAFTKESMLDSLKEAEESKGLNYLGDKVKDGRRIRVLQFTDNKGNTTILGVNEDNLPIVRFAYNKDKGAASGGVIYESGSGTNPSRESQMQNGEGGVNYGRIDPNAPRPDFEQMLKEWTENLEQPKDF